MLVASLTIVMACSYRASLAVDSRIIYVSVANKFFRTGVDF